MTANEEVVQHLTAEALGRRWGVPTWSIYQMVRKGDLPALRIGRRVRFRVTDIESWEARQVHGADEMDRGH